MCIRDRDNTAYYTPSPAEGKPNQMIKKTGASTETVNELTLPAGTIFKLNVYFEDFGKLHTLSLIHI